MRGQPWRVFSRTQRPTGTVQNLGQGDRAWASAAWGRRLYPSRAQASMAKAKNPLGIPVAADAQPAAAGQPGDRAFHLPAVAAQPGR